MVVRDKNMNTTVTTVRTLLVTIIGLALVGATPVAAAELPASEGGAVTVCGLLSADAYNTIDEIDAMLPTDPIDEPDVMGRIQLVLRQLDSRMLGLGCSVPHTASPATPDDLI